MDGKIVYNLIYSMMETDDPLNTVVTVFTFSTEEAAKKELNKQYEDMVRDADMSVLDCVRKENYGNNAKIEFGYESTDESDAGIPLVETKHRWRVAKTTIDLA